MPKCSDTTAFNKKHQVQLEILVDIKQKINEDGVSARCFYAAFCLFLGLTSVAMARLEYTSVKVEMPE